MALAPGGTGIGALVVIGGSTASGKSALAVSLAKATGGTVVNADSQQLYRDLPTLTARPTPAEEAEAPHRLYGVLGPDEQASAGRWLDLVAPILREAADDPRPLIVTGGTGLYLEALLHGIVPVPDIPPGLRARLRAEAAGVPAPVLHERLRGQDPATAARLRPSDPQRVLRALEVLAATGRPLAEWQAAARRRLPLPGPVLGLALLPPASVASPRIERRLRLMLEGPAPAEVDALRRRFPQLASLPIAKLHGCRELLAVLDGSLDPATAEARIAAQVRQYAKRQRTFFRHRLPDLVPLATTGDDAAPLAGLTARLGVLYRPDELVMDRSDA